MRLDQFYNVLLAEVGQTNKAVAIWSLSATRYVVSLNQTLIDFLKFWAWKKAQATESQYTLENVQAQQSLLFKVVDTYFTVLEAEDEIGLFKSEEETTNQQLAQIQKLYDRELAKVTELYAIEARLDQVKADSIEAEAKLGDRQRRFKGTGRGNAHDPHQVARRDRVPGTGRQAGRLAGGGEEREPHPGRPTIRHCRRR